MESQLNTVSIRESDGNIINMEIHDSLPSTSALAKEYAKKGYPDRYVVFSEKKAKSKINENKNEKYTEYEEGMFMSVILRPSIFPSQASMLSFMSSTAMVTALEEHTTKHLGLGWINDVYCEGVKIGSSWIEGKLDNFTTYEYIIITFSVKLDQRNFPPRLTDLVRKVFVSENTSVSMIIARNVLSEFFKLYANIKSSNKFMDTYSDKFILRGTKIKYISGQKKKKYKVLGIEKKDGTLILDNKHGPKINVNSPKQVIIPNKIRIKKLKNCRK